MTQASQKITQQYVDGGVIPAQLVGQDAVSKTYVDGELNLQDNKITDAKNTANMAQTDISNHKISTVAHAAQQITYSGLVGGGNVKQALDNTKTRIDNIVAQSGNDNTEIVDSRNGYPVLSDRLNAMNQARNLSSVIRKMQLGQAVKIVCYGDSMTYGYKVGSGTQVANPYPAELQANLRQIYNNNNISVMNNGHSGWRSVEALANVSEVISQAPDVCVLMFGINDAKGSSFGSIVPVSDFKLNMENVIKTILDNSIQVILCNTTPYTPPTGFLDILSYRDAVVSLSEQFKLVYVDLDDEIRKVYEEKFISSLTLSPDGIHFADGYYKYIAHVVLRVLWEAPTVSAGKNYPAVFSKYVPNNCTNVYTNAGQFYGRNYILRGTGQHDSGDYIRFPFFVDKAGLDLYIVHPRASTGTTIAVTVDGVIVASLNSYNANTMIFDVETLIKADLDFGMHICEMNYVDSSIVGPGGGWNNFISHYTFK